MLYLETIEPFQSNSIAKFNYIRCKTYSKVSFFFFMLPNVETVTTNDTEPDQQVSKSLITKTFFVDLWKVRLRDKSGQFFVLYIVAIAIVVFLLSLDIKSQSNIDPLPHPLPSSISNPFTEFINWVAYRGPSEQTKMLLTLGPSQNSLAKEINTFFQDHGNISFVLKDSKREIQTYFNSKYNPGLGAFFITNDAKSLDYNIISKLSLSNEILYLHNSVAEMLLNDSLSDIQDINHNIPDFLNFSYRGYAHPLMNGSFGSEAVTAFYVILAFFYLSIFSTSLLFKLNSEKMLFYLNLNGLKDLTMFFVFIISAIVEVVPLSLIVTIMVAFVTKSTKGTNFFIVFLSTFLASFGRTFFNFALATLFLQIKAFGVHFLVSIIFPVIFMVISMFRDNIPSAVFLVLSFFSPTESYITGFAIMVKCKEEIGALGFSDMNYKFYGITMTEIIIFQIINTLLMLGLMLLFIINNKRSYGHPLLGWKNMFNKRAWMTLFGCYSYTKLVQNYSDDSAISFENVSKIYKGHVEVQALDGVTANINPKEKIVLIGPNGSGKSTLIDCLIGSIPIEDGGSIRFFGQELTDDFRYMYDNLGIVFQNNILINELTVFEQFELIGILHGMPKDKISMEIPYLLSLLDMSDCINKRVSTLSGGQKRKLCIGLALLPRPPLMIFDEPTAGVDANSRQIIWKTLSMFNEVTSVITSHALEETESVCSRIFVLSQGKLTFQGTPAELRQETGCGYILTIIEGISGQTDDQSTRNALLKFVQNIIPEATLFEGNSQSILFPADLRAADLLNELEKEKESLGIAKYTIHIQSLEESLVKLIENDECNQANH